MKKTENGELKKHTTNSHMHQMKNERTKNLHLDWHTVEGFIIHNALRCNECVSEIYDCSRVWIEIK